MSRSVGTENDLSTASEQIRSPPLDVLRSPDLFAARLASELAPILPQSTSHVYLDTDLVADLGFDSLDMLELLDILDSLLGPEAAFNFDMKTMGTTVRSIYLYCLASLQKPFEQFFR